VLRNILLNNFISASLSNSDNSLTPSKGFTVIGLSINFAKDLGEIPMGSPPTGAPKVG